MKLNQKYAIVKNILNDKGWGGFSNLTLTLLNLMTEPIYVRSKPIFIQIEPTVSCNLMCPMCISPSLKRENRTLTFAKFKEIIGQLPYLRKISLVGAGEPLLNPELFDIIDYAKSKRMTIGFATNATLMDKGISERIVSLGLDWLNISLDGASKQTYEKIRIGADFYAVLKNIANLIRIKKREKKPDVSIWFLALKSNLAELSPLVLLADKLGIKNLYVQTAHYWANPLWKEKVAEEKINNNLTQIKQVFTKAANLANKKHIRFEYVNVPDKGNNRVCQWPWKSCYITTDGYVTPCCLHGADPKVINFGNIFEEDFKYIWNNDKYQNFRKKLKSSDIPSICVDCPSYYSKIKI